MNKLMGPPAPGPVVRVVARGMSVAIRVDDDGDAEIVRLALEMAQRRRWGVHGACQAALQSGAQR
ncbi:hypothetical protein CAZ10_10285 [Pseudomonas aeruginosa]|uniref:Uncharacterized protein n=1 Tax=Pseudomonas aeruginosa TaxID=287 RepID=A0A241XRT2_PSEAI|nr:hypothetical protein CAZ10_10285 [Pseudomonas aeruginosa]